MKIAVIVGMKSEAALLPPGLAVFASGGIPARAEALARQALAEGATALVSFGIAGGLDPALVPGCLMVGGVVQTRGKTIPTDAAWSRHLLATIPGALAAMIAGADAVAAQKIAEKLSA